MSKALVMRGVTHIRVDDNPLSMCGLSTDDMLIEGDGKKIKGVEWEEFGCKQCFSLMHAEWQKLVKDYDNLAGDLAKYSTEDMDNLIACLELVQENPGLVATALASAPITDAEAQAEADLVDRLRAKSTTEPPKKRPVRKATTPKGDKA